MHVLFLGRSVLAILGYAPAMLAPGYLAAYVLNLCNFRRLSMPEKLLWSLTLSAPLAMLISVYAGLLVGNLGVGGIFLLLAIAVVVHLSLSGGFQVQRLRLAGSDFRIILVVLIAVSLYLLVAAAPIALRGRLLEGVASCDWSVRVPLIGSAIRTGMPLLNPFYAVNGNVGPLRYYFYWYALCGVIGRSFHLPARAIMSAGTVWASWLMLATLFLLLKYLFRPSPEWAPARWGRLCVCCMLAMPVLGLDVLQAIYSLFVAKFMMPEIEWWRSRTGFAPSFHTFFLYAPHHTFGICAGLIGFLVLLLPRLPKTAEFHCSWKRTLCFAVLAGLCFGANAGCSTYVALFFAVACTLLAISFAVTSDWLMVLAIAVAGVVALTGAWDCIHLIWSNPAKASEGSFIGWQLRGWMPTWYWYTSQYTQRGLQVPRTWSNWIAQPILYVALEIAEAGVFTIVLLHRIRQDLLSRRRLLPEQRFQWLLVLSFFSCALFLTSEGTIGTNDLGFHAGFALRVAAVLWAAPWIASLWASPLRKRAFFSTVTGRIAMAMIVIGLGTQVWQMVAQRFVLLTTAPFHRFDGPFPSPPHIAQQYFETYEAWEAIDQLLPRDAHVLTNPDSPQRTMGMLYVNRQTVAPEPKCMVAFGGNLAECHSAMPLFAALFDPSTDQAAQTSVFGTACRSQHLTAVLVSRDDAVWSKPGSWTSFEKPIYAGERERVYLCHQFGVARP